MKKPPLLGLSLFALLTVALGAGCDKGGDAKLRIVATGSWARGSNGVVILAPNGTCSARFTNWHAIPPAAWAYEGTWSVHDGAITIASTNVEIWNTTNRVPITVESYKVVQADDRNLIYNLRDADDLGSPARNSCSGEKRGPALKTFGSNLVLDCKKARGSGLNHGLYSSKNRRVVEWCAIEDLNL